MIYNCWFELFININILNYLVFKCSHNCQMQNQLPHLKHNPKNKRAHQVHQLIDLKLRSLTRSRRPRMTWTRSPRTTKVTEEKIQRKTYTTNEKNPKRIQLTNDETLFTNYNFFREKINLKFLNYHKSPLCVQINDV